MREDSLAETRQIGWIEEMEYAPGIQYEDGLRIPILTLALASSFPTILYLHSPTSQQHARDSPTIVAALHTLPVPAPNHPPVLQPALQALDRLSLTASLAT